MVRSLMAVLLAGAASLGGMAAGVHAQQAQTAQPARLATEVFAELPAIEDPEISPGGKAVAAKIAVAGTQYFAIVPLDGSKPRLVGLDDTELNWSRWINDDWLVLGVGKTVPVEGDEWYIRRAIAVNADATRIVTLAKRDAAQSADDVIWVAKDGSPRILMSLQTSIYRDEQGFFPHVEEINVATGKRRTVVGEREGIWEWYADGAGLVRMGVGMTDDGRERRLIYRGDGNAPFRTLDRARTHRDALTVPALFLADTNKALTIADDDDGFSSLYELDLATLERGKRLFATPGYDIGGVVPNADGSGYLGVHVHENRAGIHWTDPALAAMQATLAGMIKGGAPAIVSLSRDRSAAIVHVGGSDAPGGYYVYRPAEGALDLLGLTNATIGLRRMHPVKTIRYKARDGLEIAAVLTLPRGGARNLPLIVMPHGGPFARDSESWDWWTQFLADRGYAVIQPNYRGSSGYGTEFAKKGEGQWGLAMQDDLNDAVAALAEQGIADPKRVCMVGASYGGYAALRAAQRDGSRFRCAVSYAGVSDLGRWMRQDRNLGSGARKDWLKMQAPDLKAVSPVNYAEQFSIPVLLMHGKEDRSVEVNHSRTMAAKLKAAGKDVTYIEQPEGDHHFSRAADRLQFLKELEAFLAKHNPA